MPITVRIPTPMRKFTDEQETVAAVGATVREVMDDLLGKFPAMKERLCDDSGNLRRFVNVFLNDEDIRFQDGPRTKVKEGDEISIIPAIAGG